MELEQLEVSVVVPVRNESKYIENCINSIISQDYPKDKLEVIFVDGKSEDCTVSIINKYIEKNNYIKLLQNPKKSVILKLTRQAICPAISLLN